MTLGLSLNQHQPFLLPPRAWTSVTMTSDLDRCQPRAAGPLGTTHSRSHSSCGFRDIHNRCHHLLPAPLSRRVHPQCSHICCAAAVTGPFAVGLLMAGVLGQARGRGMAQGEIAVTFLPGPYILGKNELHSIPISYKLPSAVAVSPRQWDRTSIPHIQHMTWPATISSAG